MEYFPVLLFIVIVGCKADNKYPSGGFDYPQNIDAKDTNFYFYQLKDIESKRDAFWDAYTYLFYQKYDEPNLSIRPLPKEMFRLTYSTSFGNSVIIRLTEDSIVVKKGNPMDEYPIDTSKLSEIENFHLNLLFHRFPIDTTGKRPYLKRYLDSLTKLYPQLLDPVYFHKLYEKAFVRNTNKFTYTTTKISLTKEQFDSLADQINSSGFWAMPYKIVCKEPPTDDVGFSLEANTKTKYKIVRVDGCQDDSSKFARACQILIDMAKMNKEINLISTGRIVTLDSPEFQKIRK